MKVVFQCLKSNNVFFCFVLLSSVFFNSLIVRYVYTVITEISSLFNKEKFPPSYPLNCNICLVPRS